MNEPYEGMWDFSGKCAPKEDGSDSARFPFATFTLGCFQWVALSRGKGLKRGKVQYRIKGYAQEPKEAYASARAYCSKKNEMVRNGYSRS